MLLKMIQPLLPRLNASRRKPPNLSAEATPEVILALGVNMALLQVPLVIVGNAVGAGQMCLEIGGRVESGATLGGDIVDVDFASPHLCLTVNSEFVLTPLLCGGECFVAEKGAAVGFV
jgi:hypothetical protein